MISPAELALLAFAGYRGTQLIVHDSLLDGARDRIIAWQGGRARTAVVTLMSCVYCVGWWVSGAFLAVWLLGTGQWHGVPLVLHGVEWFATAGAAVLLSRWDDSRHGG
ncbi:hypothetical protein GCM10010387_15650 [Streptomyces inusitatus]|uniref:DUF1360 domain-containing protein n=1 Tax=Streptomyces inusitatus TaxID=68221 RepID=A0A918UMZ2_9ACTN|nr:hypothetical protein [Streptomyces inusitatus]GGZ23375.1 hypothetical protein GCM10010387_15650 [Streptomyces inusitatus]